jgi:hypothetical protein
MGWFKRKHDPLSERASDLTQQIKQLEAQIQQLATQADEPPAESHPAPAHSPATPPTRRDPVFENVSQDRLKDLNAPPAHFNDLGVRKYDLPAAWRRLMNHIRGPASANPKLVDLLAAGSLQGMRPLRYEKRIARNRFIIFVIVLLLVLWGLFAVFVTR